MSPDTRQALVDYLQSVAELWDARGLQARELGGVRAPGQCLPESHRVAFNRAPWLDGGYADLNLGCLLIEPGLTRRDASPSPDSDWNPQVELIRLTPADDVWRSNKRVLVVGGVGSGKATLLRLLAARMARATLRKLQTGQVHELDIPHLACARLSSAAALADSVAEIPEPLMLDPGSYPDLRHHLLCLVNQAPPNGATPGARSDLCVLSRRFDSVLITVSDTGATICRSLLGWDEKGCYNLAPVGWLGAIVFVRGYFGKDSAKADSLIRALLLHSQGIHKNPHHLSLVCAAHEQRPFTLASSAVELLEGILPNLVDSQASCFDVTGAFEVRGQPSWSESDPAALRDAQRIAALIEHGTPLPFDAPLKVHLVDQPGLAPMTEWRGSVGDFIRIVRWMPNWEPFLGLVVGSLRKLDHAVEFIRLVLNEDDVLLAGGLRDSSAGGCGDSMQPFLSGLASRLICDVRSELRPTLWRHCSGLAGRIGDLIEQLAERITSDIATPYLMGLGRPLGLHPSWLARVVDFLENEESLVDASEVLKASGSALAAYPELLDRLMALLPHCGLWDVITKLGSCLVVHQPLIRTVASRKPYCGPVMLGLPGGFPTENDAVCAVGPGLASDREAIKGLLGFLEHDDCWVRLRAAYNLASVGPALSQEPIVVEPLKRFLLEPAFMGPAAIVFSGFGFALLSQAEVLSTMVENLDRPDDFHRRHTTVALRSLADVIALDKGVLEKLVEGVSGEFAEDSVCQVLRAVGPKLFAHASLVDKLAEGLTDPERSTRVAVVFQSMGPTLLDRSDLVERIIALLDDAKYRDAAETALSNAGPRLLAEPRAMNHFTRTLSEDTYSESTMDALRSIGPSLRGHGPSMSVLTIMLGSRSLDFRTDALRVLGGLGRVLESDDQILESLVGILTEEPQPLTIEDRCLLGSAAELMKSMGVGLARKERLVSALLETLVHGGLDAAMYASIALSGVGAALGAGRRDLCKLARLLRQPERILLAFVALENFGPDVLQHPVLIRALCSFLRRDHRQIGSLLPVVGFFEQVGMALANEPRILRAMVDLGDEPDRRTLLEMLLIRVGPAFAAHRELRPRLLAGKNSHAAMIFRQHWAAALA